MQLRIDPHGSVYCVYGEAIDLSLLGTLSIRRASRVEPDHCGQWWADLSPLHGPKLGVARRSGRECRECVGGVAGCRSTRQRQDRPVGFPVEYSQGQAVLEVGERFDVRARPGRRTTARREIVRDMR